MKKINSEIFNKLFWYNFPEAKWASTLPTMYRSPSVFLMLPFHKDDCNEMLTLLLDDYWNMVPLWHWRKAETAENNFRIILEDTLHFCQCLNLSVAATPQSSHAKSCTLLCKSHTHLQDSDVPSADTKYRILSSVWQWNASQNSSSEVQFWPNSMHADASLGTLYL